MIGGTHGSDKRPYLRDILAAIGLDAAAHINAPGPHLCDRRGDVARMQAAGQQDRAPPSQVGGASPIGDNAGPAIGAWHMCIHHQAQRLA